MKKILLALSAISLLGFASCTKEEDDNAMDVSKNAYLTKSYWQVTSVMVNDDYYEPTSIATERFQDLPICFRDNVYDFPTASQFIIDENNVKCDANNPQQTNYYYSVTNNDKAFKVWSNPDDPGASMWFNGEIATVNINKFFTTQYTVVGTKTVQTVTTYEAIRRKPTN